MSTYSYPAEIEIRPIGNGPLAPTPIRVPGSKSITNRALILAALSAPPEGTLLTGALQSEDTEVMIESLDRLGFDVQTEWENYQILVRKPKTTRRIPVSAADLYVANSGTSMRFLSALVSLGQGRYRLDGIERMRQRPIEDLLVPLRNLGVRATTEKDNGYPPVVIQTQGLMGGSVTMRADQSSQFLSALLMTAPFAEGPITIELEGKLVSEPYIAITLRMMDEWGLPVDQATPGKYAIVPTEPAEIDEYAIEPDASAASYFFAAAAICGGKITLEGLGMDAMQGDIRFVQVLEQMGCKSRQTAEGIELEATGKLQGIDVDMNAISDTVMTLAAVACFATGSTNIRNVAHIRHKETDRIVAIATELRKVGITVDEREDGLTIHPGPMHAARIATYNDHRMAMSLALLGLKVPGIIITDPGCVAKTYPGFWEDFERVSM